MASLLEPSDLLQAIAGRSVIALPLAEWARELGDLYAELIPSRIDQKFQPKRFDGEQLRSEIDRVVSEIDEWAAQNIPRMKSARKHTHSLGEVISHVARSYAQAWWTVVHSADTEIWHQAWFHLGEAREGYAEFLSALRARNLQLPMGWRWHVERRTIDTGRDPSINPDYVESDKR
ncbi:hypothetical protein ACIHAX_36320 [Nocardia sp. NPDC051929]|uniref:hypothetical protein n=1 Tax=Nocardia sp. NPDC051929 TaxID=3364327 RepID=UPI0037C90A3A